jgi:gluconolactonase
MGFTEGPVFRAAGDIVVVSPGDGCVYRIDDSGSEVLAVTGGGPNGLTEWSDGSLFVAQNGGAFPARRWPYVTGGVQIVRPGGKVDWLTQDPVSPNDLCFGPDGLLYVTDPTRSRRDDGRIWRCDPLTGEAELLTSVPWYPNGIGFAKEDDAVYVASTGEQSIVRFALTTAGLGKPETVVQMTSGYPDGFAFDMENHIVIGAVGTIDGRPERPGTIQTWTLDGERLDELQPGPSPFLTNLAISADARLVVTDSVPGSVVLFESWPHPGLALHPFRELS